MPATGPLGGAAAVTRVRAAVAAALAPHPAVVLAVSGGRDSMVLLDAALAVAADRVRAVATYHHGTGPAAARAARRVRAEGRARGLAVRVGRAAPGLTTEAAWRAARWRFLRRVARELAAGAGGHARVATGHTRDDQVETVVMRLLRGAGARGLAAMYAPARGVVRPLLDVASADVAAYAAAVGLRYVDDPSNAAPAHLRNRVRHDLLPALRTVWPALDSEVLACARQAAAWRADSEAFAAALAACCPPPLWDAVPGAADGAVALGDFAQCTSDSLAAVWPAVAARAGVRLDRRGTARVATFTARCAAALRAGEPPRGTAVLAGGALVAVERRGAAGSPEWAMVVRPTAGERAATGAASAVASAPVPVRGRTRLGRWQLRVLARPPAAAEFEAGRAAWFAADRPYVVRGWRPGDRWRPGGAAARRVKRFLADRRVPAPLRAGWPVVVAAARDAAEGEIVWVPGVRRSSAAPARPGQPGFYLHCERTPERPRAGVR